MATPCPASASASKVCGAPLVPLENIAVSQGFSPVRHAGYFQPVAIGSKYGRNNGNPLSGFGEREQGVRGAACPTGEHSGLAGVFAGASRGLFSTCSDRFEVRTE